MPAYLNEPDAIPLRLLRRRTPRGPTRACLAFGSAWFWRRAVTVTLALTVTAASALVCSHAPTSAACP